MAEQPTRQGFASATPASTGATPFARIAVKRVPAYEALPSGGEPPAPRTGQTVLAPPSRGSLAPSPNRPPALPARQTALTTTAAPFSDGFDPSESIRGPAILGLAVTIAFLGILLLWSFAAQLESAAIAPAVIKVQDSRRTIQHQSGGTIKELLVHEGDSVRKDQVLIRLDDGALRAQVATLATQLDGLVALRSQLLAAQSGEPNIAFEFDRDRTEGFGQKDDERLAGLMQRQRDELSAKRASIANQTELLRQRQALLARQLEGDRGQEAAQATQIKLVQQELKAAQQLLEQGLMTSAHVLELQRTEAQLLGSRAERTAAIAQAREGIRGAEIQIEQLKRDRASQVAGDLLTTNEKIEDLTPRLANARAELIGTEIKAPVDGSVISQSVFTIGGVIRPGEKILDVVPEGEPLILEGKLQPEQVDGVSIGMRVEVRFPEFSSRDMPILHGTVTGLSADRILDPTTNLGFFRLAATIDPKELAATPHDHLMPGLPADIIVPLKSRSAFDYLTSPLRHSFSHAFRER
ncbi:MAG: type secretion rane fusion protein HlyD family [Rhodospirillales bacterium]|nr:type secretion rane fusion protein HlyD family [Rhodospirillales bacterium]